MSSAFKPSLFISLKTDHLSLALQLKIWNCSGIKGNIRYIENMHRYMDMYASLCIVHSSVLGESTGRLSDFV